MVDPKMTKKEILHIVLCKSLLPKLELHIQHQL